MPLDPMHKDSPLNTKAFDEMKTKYGDAAAWDALFALGFGSDDWEEILPTITVAQLEKVTSSEALSSGVGASRVDTRVLAEAPTRNATKEPAIRNDKTEPTNDIDRVARNRLARSSY